MSQSNNKDFLGKAAPIGYVAGLGRGAHGFTTSADYGPNRVIEKPKHGESVDIKAAAEEARRMFQIADRSGGQLNSSDSKDLDVLMVVDKEDEEADRVYAQVEQRLQNRRKRKQQLSQTQESGQEQAKQAPLQVDNDLKQQLQSISAEEWANIPDAVDLVAAGRKSKRARERLLEKQFFGPTKDFILDSARNNLKREFQVVDFEQQQQASTYGMNMDEVDPLISDEQQKSAINIKDELIRSKLDRVAKSTLTGQQSDNQRTDLYLSQLTQQSSATNGLQSYGQSKEQQQLRSITDIQTTRQLLTAVIESEPYNPQSWLAAAYLEEQDGQFDKARKLLEQGCIKCPKNEDLWLNAVRMARPESIKLVLGNALSHLRQSELLWIKAIEMESNLVSKVKIIDEALRQLPTSTSFWLLRVDHAKDDSERLSTLHQAVQMANSDPLLWQKLLSLESQQEIDKSFSMALQQCGDVDLLLITISCAKRLEDLQSGQSSILKVLQKGLQKAMQSQSLDAPQILNHAQNCIESGHKVTASAVIDEFVLQYRSDLYTVQKWQSIVDESFSHSQSECLLILLIALVRKYPNGKTGWFSRAVNLALECGQTEYFDHLIKLAIDSEELYDVKSLLKVADYLFDNGHHEKLFNLLDQCTRKWPKCEDFWLHYINITTSLGEKIKAQQIISDALNYIESDRLQAQFLSQMKDYGDLKQFQSQLDLALEKYPKSVDLLLMKADSLEQSGDTKQLRQLYASATSKCPLSIDLWLRYVKFERQTGSMMKARALINKALQRNSKNQILHQELSKLK
ncbi:hypothetical protein MIR68_003319 [Amoeboaphelidium protococcarum]|nr:hypothetical protein MIR68_003319 [Amoeboaphelidium protococcarum]